MQKAFRSTVDKRSFFHGETLVCPRWNERFLAGERVVYCIGKNNYWHRKE